MKNIVTLSVVVLLAVACVAPPRAQISPTVSFSPHAYETPPLGTGDPVRGRKAFVDLRCHACHRVAGDPSLPQVEGAPEGRLLRGLCDESAESVAWKIVSRTEMSAESLYDDSPMHESASLMTERQLVDLVAYLRNPTEGCREE